MNIVTDTTTVMAVLGVLAFAVSVITQLLRDMGFTNKIPNALPSTVIAVVLTVLAYMGYCSYSAINIEWYMIAGTIVAGFVVAYISLYGWKKICDLYQKHKKK